MANTYLKRTGTTTVNTYTFSAWIKLGTLTVANNTYQVLFSSGNQNILGIYGGATTSGHNALYHYNNTNLWWTNNLLRDPSAWYHVVAKVSGGTVTTYINGVQTSYATSTYSLGALETTADKTCLGCYAPSATSFFRGSMSHVHFISGTAYDPSAFGETDTTTGEWKIKTSPSVTYGADGFFILKDGNSVTDQSGNSNNFTVGGGTLTKTEDNPSNVFATLNPLVYNTSNKVYGFGNTAITSSPNNSGEWQSTQTTLGASTGKYYCEIKINAIGNYHTLGVGYQPNISNVTSTQNIGELSGSAGWRNNGQTGIGNSFDTGGNPSLNTYTTGDILGIAMDLTNSKLYFSKNGTWENSGVPTSGSTGTGSIRNLTSGEAYHFVIAPRGGSTYCNFGNGYFGSTQISSAGTNASGNGIFEFDVPNGFTALSTKGLNT